MRGENPAYVDVRQDRDDDEMRLYLLDKFSYRLLIFVFGGGLDGRSSLQSVWRWRPSHLDSIVVPVLLADRQSSIQLWNLHGARRGREDKVLDGCMFTC